MFFVRKKYPSRGVFRTKDVLQYDGKEAGDFTRCIVRESLYDSAALKL